MPHETENGTWSEHSINNNVEKGGSGSQRVDVRKYVNHPLPYVTILAVLCGIAVGMVISMSNNYKTSIDQLRSEESAKISALAATMQGNYDTLKKTTEVANKAVYDEAWKAQTYAELMKEHMDELKYRVAMEGCMPPTYPRKMRELHP